MTRRQARQKGTTVRDDLVRELLACGAALAMENPPAVIFRHVDEALKHLVGHRLFTILASTDDAAYVKRVYSSNEESYPLSARKKMGVMPWDDLVLRKQNTFVGNDSQAIRWAFPDHDLIQSLGLEAVINAPVVLSGRTLGSVSLLDSAQSYMSDEQLKTVLLFMPLLIPALQDGGKG